MSQNNKIAILGGGMSGLTSIKACLEEGLNPVCFERTEDLGGLWRFKTEDVDGVSSVAKSTIINTSKEPSAFSDFPPPTDFPNYMHNRYMCKYFNLYADHFGLRKYIKFNHKISWVTPCADFDKTGQWLVTVTRVDPITGAEEDSTDEYDGVMICTGHHAYPFVPKYEGMEEFGGIVKHTHGYKIPNEFENKNVLVIGNGNSGSDAAVEMSSVAEQAYLSTRRGFWIRYRLGPRGYPGDLSARTRAAQLGLLPYKLKNYLQEKQAEKILDYETYGMKASHSILAQHPTVSDVLPNKILSGAVKIKGPVSKFVPGGVLFEGEETPTPMDGVIFATGYKVNFPFLSKEVAKLSDEECELYLYMFPPHLKHHTLAFIGNVQPIGPLFPISELQARWFARVFKGKSKLPATPIMMEDIKRRAAVNSNFFISGTRHVTEVQVIPYCDLIASQFGAKPDFWKLFWNDFALFRACFFKAHLAYQYRLDGPHSWDGARNAILTYEDRVKAAFDTNIIAVKRRKMNVNSNDNLIFSLRNLLLIFLSLATAIYFMM